MPRLINRLTVKVFVIFKTSTSALELLNALYLLVWAAVLLFGSDSMYSLRGYAVFRSCPIPVLVLLFAGVGVGLLSALMYKSNRSDILGGFLMLCAGLVWVGVSAAFVQSYPPLHPVLMIHPLLAFFDWLAGMFLIESAKARRRARGGQ